MSESPVTITFTYDEYNLLLRVMGEGYRRIREKETDTAYIERMDQLRAHVISADLFTWHISPDNDKH